MQVEAEDHLAVRKSGQRFHSSPGEEVRDAEQPRHERRQDDASPSNG